MYKVASESSNSFALVHAGYLIDNVSTEAHTLFVTPQALAMARLPCGELASYEFILSSTHMALLGKGATDINACAIPLVDHTGAVWDIRVLFNDEAIYSELVALPGDVATTRYWGNFYDNRMIVHTLCELTDDVHAIVDHLVKWHGARRSTLRVRKITDIAAAVAKRGDTQPLDILKFGAFKDGIPKA
jgi:hypothetical protein